MIDLLLNVPWFSQCIAIFLGFCLVAILVLIFDFFKYHRLARQRQGLSICQFARSFDYRRVDTKIIRAVYNGFQQQISFGITGFPVMATDDIAKIYFWEDEELHDFAQELAMQTGRSWDLAENNPLYGKVNTVKDLVLFLNYQPKLVQ